MANWSRARVWWSRFGDANSLWSLLPKAGASAVTSLLAWFAAQPGWAVALIGLGALFFVYSMLWIAPSQKHAWMAISVILLISCGVTYTQYGGYKLKFVGVESGLIPVTADRSQAAGLVAGLRLENPNPFPVFMIVDRRHTAAEGASSDAPISPDRQPFEIRANSHFIINGENVQFVRPLLRSQVAGGSTDFQFCYGRDKDSLDKGMLVQVDFQVRFDERAGVMTTNGQPIVKDISCG